MQPSFYICNEHMHAYLPTPVWQLRISNCWFQNSTVGKTVYLLATRANVWSDAISPFWRIVHCLRLLTAFGSSAVVGNKIFRKKLHCRLTNGKINRLQQMIMGGRTRFLHDRRSATAHRCYKNLRTNDEKVFSSCPINVAAYPCNAIISTFILLLLIVAEPY